MVIKFRVKVICSVDIIFTSIKQLLVLRSICKIKFEEPGHHLDLFFLLKFLLVQRKDFDIENIYERFW